MAKNGIEFSFTVNNLPATLDELEYVMEQALTECGMEAERTAKQRCPVADPDHWKWGRPPGGYIGGTLRNSITFALDGQSAKDNGYKVEKGNKASGKYAGRAPKENQDGVRSMYIGTNVYYAPYVEMGTKKYPKPRPFIKPALVENQKEFERIFKRWLNRP